MAHNQFPLNLNDFRSYTDADKILADVQNIRVKAKEKTQSPASLHSNELDNICKRNTEKPNPEERSGAVREVMIIEVSSSEEEESTISESDNVESWMLLGCEVDDKDDDILLNLVGCDNSVNEG